MAVSLASWSLLQVTISSRFREWLQSTWRRQVDGFLKPRSCVGGKQDLEGGFGKLGVFQSSKLIKRMGPLSSPSPNGTASHFVATDLFTLNRTEHRKSCVGDQTDIFKTPPRLFKVGKFRNVLCYSSRAMACCATADLLYCPTPTGSKSVPFSL